MFVFLHLLRQSCGFVLYSVNKVYVLHWLIVVCWTNLEFLDWVPLGYCMTFLYIIRFDLLVFFWGLFHLYLREYWYRITFNGCIMDILLSNQLDLIISFVFIVTIKVKLITLAHTASHSFKIIFVGYVPTDGITEPKIMQRLSCQWHFVYSIFVIRRGFRFSLVKFVLFLCILPLDVGSEGPFSDI